MGSIDDIWEALRAIDEISAEDPPAGRKAAEEALARLGRLSEPPPALLAFAAQVEGTTWRAVGDYEAARRCYRRAESIYWEALVTCGNLALRRRLTLGQAELHRRWSFLCLERLDWDRGMVMLDLAEAAYTGAGQWHDVGWVCLARGQLFWERNRPGDQDLALELLSHAVEMIDPEKSEILFTAAGHNLAWALTLHPDPDPESLDRAFESLRRSRLSRASKKPGARRRQRQLFGHARVTVPDAKRRHLQGKIQLRLCQYEDARFFFESSRHDLMVLGNYPRDVFAVTLDLVECYLWIFRHPWRRVTALLAETFVLCPVHDISPETQAALELLRIALEAQNTQAAREHLDTVRRHFIGDK